jgi:ABC-2 type transport system permease protein
MLNNTISHSNTKTNIPLKMIAERWNKAIGFIKRDLAITVSYKFQFIFQFLQVLFSVASIYFVGKMLGNTENSSVLKVYQADYFSFALVGLAVSSYLKVGLVTLTNDIRQTMNQGTLEAMCASPTGYQWLLFCTTLWPFIFETIRVFFHFAVGMAVFGFRFNNANWLGASITVLLTIPIFLLLGMISCSLLILIKKGDPINWIFSNASSLLAGTLFPYTVLPKWLRVIAECLPLTHSLEALRKSLLTGSSIGEVKIHLFALVIFVLILLPITLLVNNICMKKARKSGAFSTH